MPDADKILEEIRALYFRTSPARILDDFDRAIDLLKSLDSDSDRQRATVYMEGLAEMRREWKASRPAPAGRTPARRKPPKP